MVALKLLTTAMVTEIKFSIKPSSSNSLRVILLSLSDPSRFPVINFRIIPITSRILRYCSRSLKEEFLVVGI